MTAMEPNKESNAAELPEPMYRGQGEVMSMPVPEVASQPAPIFTASQPQPTPQNIQPAVQPFSTASQVTADPAYATTSALIADDADLIEKEWVLKAKAIVAQTVHDPNLQTKEIGKVKAEYLKKRYNKNLKQDEV